MIAGYGADVVALGRTDHFIQVDAETVSSQAIEALQDWARAHGLDAIVSADGDGTFHWWPTKLLHRYVVI